jgi:hypothetical protein
MKLGDKLTREKLIQELRSLLRERADGYMCGQNNSTYPSCFMAAVLLRKATIKAIIKELENA